MAHPDLTAAAAEAIRRRIAVIPHTGVVLGSGLSGLADALDDAVRIPYDRIPHFPVSSVSGHRGELTAGRLNGLPLCVLAGRVHVYEGLGMDRVVFPVRVLAGLGVRTLILTNACGAIDTTLAPGDIVAIRDHINLMGDNPLRGSADFTDLSAAYDPGMLALAQAAATDVGLTLRRGVYAALSGPCYETPAEIRAYRILGADLVGMSTVPETIAARSLGLRVLALSMVTNMACGVTDTPLSHQEVLDTAERTGERFRALLGAVVGRIAKDGKGLSP